MILQSFAHVARLCADAQETVDFYTGTVGLPMTTARGSSSETRSGIHAGYPKMYGRLAAEGRGKDIAFLVARFQTQ